MDWMVKQYLTRFDQTDLTDLLLLRGRIMSMVEHCEESLDYGFPIYFSKGKAIAGYARRSDGLMFFLLNPDIVDKYRDKLAGSVEGRVRICLKRPNDTMDTRLLDVIDDMLWEAV
ncbi:MAG: hypothetical protein J7639_17505 [Paenibacillaceae bacterium]|nr:hypothetical protein [Paenibacillaceae bacterium]